MKINARKYSAIFIVLILLGRMTGQQALADELPHNPFIKGSGYLSLTNTSDMYDQQNVYIGHDGVGSTFSMHSFVDASTLTMYIQVPSMMWSGYLTVSTPENYLTQGMTASAVFQTSTANWGAVPYDGVFEIDELHRRHDGFVDLLEGHFYQPNQYAGGGKVWEEGEIHYSFGLMRNSTLETPEPSSLMLIGLSASLFVAKRRSRS